MSLSNPLQKVSTDDRKLQAMAVVAVVGTLGRFVDPSLQVVMYAGLLAGVVNAPRTGELEYATKFGGLPAAYGGVVVGLALFVSVPFDLYAFPVQTVWGEQLFSAVGPLFELFAYAVLYFVEGVFSFLVVKRLPGVSSTQPE